MNVDFYFKTENKLIFHFIFGMYVDPNKKRCKWCKTKKQTKSKQKKTKKKNYVNVIAKQKMYFFKSKEIFFLIFINVCKTKQIFLKIMQKKRENRMQYKQIENT